MTDDRQYRLGLSDLLEQDLSSYEFFSSLPPHLQEMCIRDSTSAVFKQLCEEFCMLEKEKSE